MSILQQTSFFTTVNHLKDLPELGLPEVAFAGRSNAGKSTAINTLCQQRKLAFASKTPGRTQHLNYFAVQKKETQFGFLVDLPGYGYAQVPGEARLHWDKLLGTYIKERAALKGLIIIMDARRPFTDLDHQLVEWYAPTGGHIHVVLTKADKLNRSECQQALNTTRAILKSYRIPEREVEYTAQLFSSLKLTGIEEATAVLEKWLNIPEELRSEPVKPIAKTIVKKA